ncbi:MAG: HAD-IA family hydrolase [Burkholderiaceae bacterium]|nr:HAD-IA family hydrolase [Burkholderiaceae bacterium]
MKNVSVLPPPRAVLFDLDGTLADSAPDLAAAANLLRTARGLEPTPYEKLRAVASSGARGLIGAAFGLTPEDEGYPELHKEFLDNYQSMLAINSSLFDGIAALLQHLQHNGLPWGIVTNKFTRFTQPLVAQIGLHEAACVISGDTTPHSKPHPAPLLEAARRLSLPPEQCWYVGDDQRDIQAGKAASMTTVVAGWGYCDNNLTPSWGADWISASPLQLLDLIRQTVF